MKQVMNYHKDNGLLNMIRRTDPMIVERINSLIDDANNSLKKSGHQIVYERDGGDSFNLYFR